MKKRLLTFLAVFTAVSKWYRAACERQAEALQHELQQTKPTTFMGASAGSRGYCSGSCAKRGCRPGGSLMSLAVAVVALPFAYLAGLWTRARADHLISFRAGFEVGRSIRSAVPGADSKVPADSHAKPSN